MRNMDIAVERMYSIKTPQLTYNNIVLNCDLESHNTLIERGRVIYGFSECRLYEYVEYVALNASASDISLENAPSQAAARIAHRTMSLKHVLLKRTNCPVIIAFYQMAETAQGLTPNIRQVMIDVQCDVKGLMCSSK